MQAFKKQAVDVANMDVEVISYQQSATRLRAMVQSGLLRHTDLVERPERFFLAHRLLAQHAARLGPGFWIRFTVHYNLCMGTVLGLGSDQQVQELDDIQARGKLPATDLPACSLLNLLPGPVLIIPCYVLWCRRLGLLLPHREVRGRELGAGGADDRHL